MNDKIIINVISKTYFAIVSFLSFIFLLLTLVFITLQNGLYLESVSIPKLKAQQVYIKWNKNIDISINELSLNSTDSSTSSTLKTETIQKYIQIFTQTTHWFNSIIIKQININNLHGSFFYKYAQESSLNLSSAELTLNASLWIKSNTIKIDLNKFTSLKNNINANGNFIFNIENMHLYTKLNVDINNDANLTLYSVANKEKLTYKTISNKEITHTNNIIEMLNLPIGVRYWVLDAIEMSALDITDIHGFIDFYKPESTLENIYVKADVKDLNYTYNPKLDAIHTKETELEFKKGVLNIRPKKAYSYGMFLDKSWLYIDFTQKEELLSLYLLFNGRMDKNLLKVLDTYKIKLPFEQKTGSINTNLNIQVNLITLDVDAKGDFYTKKANFDYLGLNLDIYDAYIALDNYKAQIKSMQASYKNIAHATVKMNYDAKEQEGLIDFHIDKMKLNNLRLDTSRNPLVATYSISKKQDSIHINNSIWKHNGKEILLDAVDMPIDINTLDITIPTTFIDYATVGSAFVSGNANLKKMKLDLNADILKLAYNGVELSQSNTPLQIKYDDKLFFISKEPIFFNVNGTNYQLDTLNLNLDSQYVYLQNSKLKIGRYLSTKIYTKYNIKEKKAHISLSDVTLTDASQENIYYKKNKIMLSVKLNKDAIDINSPELDANFILNSKEWKLSLNSLNRIAKNSPQMQQLHIHQGDFVLHKKNTERNTHFSANLIYPYKILTDNGKPTNKYHIDGKIKKDSMYVKVNNQANINIEKEIKITLNKTGVNIDELLRFIQDTNSSSNSDKTKITMHAKDSYLYVSDERSIVADTIDLQYSKKLLTAQLKHHKGKAGLRIENNKLNVYGKNFNDKFMEKLFAHSKFKGGDFDFSISGTLDEYDGLFHIKNTTIIEYAVLNNILAFINTVPSLVTFTLPDYNQNGLFAKQAYTSFSSKNKHFNFKDIFLESKELKILGKGEADLNKNNINIDLNLKTDLGSNLSQVPVVGYILFDKDSISTTLKITGDLSNPSVDTLIAKEIVVAPLNIIKRTLTLPLKLLESATQEVNSSK